MTGETVRECARPGIADIVNWAVDAVQPEIRLTTDFQAAPPFAAAVRVINRPRVHGFLSWFAAGMDEMLVDEFTRLHFNLRLERQVPGI